MLSVATVLRYQVDCDVVYFNYTFLLLGGGECDGSV